MSVVFLDCETTGLDPRHHVPWEIGLIDSAGEEHAWLLDLTEQEAGNATPAALKIGGYYERARPDVHPMVGIPGWTRVAGRVPVDARRQFATMLVGLIGDAHIVGAVPSFDDRFVGDFLRKVGCLPLWHYHLVDIEALVAGKLGIQPPWKSDDLSRMIGVDPEQYERHTAGLYLSPQLCFRGVEKDTMPKEIITLYVCQNPDCRSYYGSSSMGKLETEANFGPATDMGGRLVDDRFRGFRSQCPHCKTERVLRYAELVPEKVVEETRKEVKKRLAKQ